MKKGIILFLVICCFLTACTSYQDTATETDALFETAPSSAICPLPSTINIEQLDNCTVAVSLKEGDAYVDDTGAMQMKVTVYDYDLYDMVDIARLEAGDTIAIRQQDVLVSSVERTESGAVLINGGLDVGGYELHTDNGTVFYEIGYSDVKSWQEIGQAAIRVSPEFQYYDRSDPDNGEVIFYPGDFLTDGTGIDYNFHPGNTTITIKNGHIIVMERVYTP